MRKLFLLLIISCFFSGCEKDDICDENTPTTPKVVIEFYDAANPTDLKKVTNLGVFNTDFTIGFGFNDVSIGKIPLKTFNYTRRTEYVSRACGYKTLYVLDTTDPVVVTTDGNNWIQSVTVSQPNIENENETHVKIYF